MSAIDGYVANNERHHVGTPLDARPRRRTAIVTCMDARLDLFDALGLQLGDSHIIRNAGGAVTDDVIRSLVISQRMLGTREVMLVLHTGCGLLGLRDEQLHEEIEEETGIRPHFDFEAFDDLDGAAREFVLRVRRSPFLPHRDGVRGFVYDVAGGRLREISAALTS